jgi:DNA-binding protein H-NS
MESNSFRSMSTDELWNLHEQVALTLADKIAAKKAKLDERLRLIERVSNVVRLDQRRPYPKVIPKYQNPQNPAETWSGRGKQPRWLVAQLQSGNKLDNFLIAPSPAQEHRKTG